jgi:hypothetical protein
LLDRSDREAKRTFDAAKRRAQVLGNDALAADARWSLQTNMFAVEHEAFAMVARLVAEFVPTAATTHNRQSRQSTFCRFVATAYYFAPELFGTQQVGQVARSVGLPAADLERDIAQISEDLTREFGTENCKKSAGPSATGGAVEVPREATPSAHETFAFRGEQNEGSEQAPGRFRSNHRTK